MDGSGSQHAIQGENCFCGFLTKHPPPPPASLEIGLGGALTPSQPATPVAPSCICISTQLSRP